MELERLREPEGRRLLRRAEELLDAEPRPERAAAALRREVSEPGLAAAALGQVDLRRHAAAKLGDWAPRLYLTREGLEQATRLPVARRRARRLAESGARTVADLCCGLGVDAAALAEAGLEVLAVEADPEVAARARANLEELGFAGSVRVRCEDAAGVDLRGRDAMYADPARRIAGRRIFDPERYSPPLSRLWAASEGVSRRVVKVGPGVDHAVIPADAEAEWVGVGGEVVEAALWRGDLARAPRRASVLRGAEVCELTGSGRRRAEVGALAEYLCEPHGTVLRSGLVAELAEQLDAHVGHPEIAYLYADAPASTGFGVWFRVLEKLPLRVKAIRAELRRRGVGRLTVKKRGADVDPQRLHAQLKPAGDAEAVLVATRLGERHVALLCERLPRADDTHLQ